MKNLKLLLIIAFTIVYSQATGFFECEPGSIDCKPEPCTSPPQFRSKFSEYNEKQKYYMRARLTYDAVFKRERVIDEVYTNSSKEHYDIIYLHQEQKQYKLNLKTRECSIENITRPWRNIAIPESAQSLGQSYIGTGQLPGAGLLTNDWYGEYDKKDNETIKYMLKFTSRACLPISAVFLSDKTGSTVLHFSDIKLGIWNLHVFDIPKECVGKQ